LRFLQPLDLPLGRPFSLHQDKIPLPQTTGPQPLLKFEILSCGDWVRNPIDRQYQFERGAYVKKPSMGSAKTGTREPRFEALVQKITAGK
jgi:hypothetical protein